MTAPKEPAVERWSWPSIPYEKCAETQHLPNGLISYVDGQVHTVSCRCQDVEWEPAKRLDQTQTQIETLQRVQTRYNNALQDGYDAATAYQIAMTNFPVGEIGDAKGVLNR